MPPRLPPRIPLAQTPTPIQEIPRLGRRFSLRLRIKRDDWTGLVPGGNKIRKLEFLLQEARQKKADTLITCGGIQSNHARATAYLAKIHGFSCRLLLRGEDSPPYSGNLLLDYLFDARIQTVTSEEYDRIDSLFPEVEEELKRKGKRPYVIPEGGSNALGACGYIRAMLELRKQMGQANLDRQCLILPVGSGGTYAGLFLAKKLLRLKTRLVGVNVCDDAAYFQRRISGILQEAREKFRWKISFLPEEIEILDGYVGRGYDLSRPEELELLLQVSREEGILLDPTYTGKAFFGMTDQLIKNKKNFGSEILFLHTGGLFSLFAKSREISDRLAAQTAARPSVPNFRNA